MRRLENETSEIASLLERRKGEGLSCALLVGAGCSASAEIPTASGFVARILEIFKSEVGGTPLPATYTYKECMERLYKADPNEYHRVIHSWSSPDKLNPAYLAIAGLLKNEFVDRILTTNFDPLIARACNLVGVDPAIYDITAIASDTFQPSHATLPAVFYLHGQHTGIVHLNRTEDFDRYGNALASLIQHTNRECVWIVVGYSGENDETFRHLGGLKHFEHRLYWVALNKEYPCQEVMDRLANAENACLVRGYDADRFFASLARQLECYPPYILSRPFVRMQQLIQMADPPKAWWTGQEDLERETIQLYNQAAGRVERAIDFFDSTRPAYSVRSPTGGLETPKPSPGLILNLSTYRPFNKQAFAEAAQLTSSWGEPNARVRAFQSNWGPVIVAVEHHTDILRHCWLMCSPQARPDFLTAESLIGRLCPSAACHPVDIEDPSSIVEVQEKTEAIYRHLGPELDLKPYEITADITGGLSSMTGGIVLATLDGERTIEYLRQQPSLIFSDAEGKAVALTREQIVENQILISIRTSAAMVREVVVREPGNKPPK